MKHHQFAPMTTHRQVLGLSTLKLAAAAFTLSLFSIAASAQSSVATSYFDVAEVKAQCQRVVKLHVQRLLIKSDDRLAKNLARSTTGLERVAATSADWVRHVKRPEYASKVVADVRALNALVLVPAASEAALADAVALADRCTTDAEALLGEFQGAGAGGRAVALAGKALYLSQRMVRDWMLLHAKTQYKGVTVEATAKERDELATTLQQLAALPATAATRASLDQVQNQWTLLQPMLGGQRSPDKDDQVARISERLFEALNESLQHTQKAVMAML